MKKIGIIVARFQVPSLHTGHVHLIREAMKQSDELVIFLGYKVTQPDTKNPFTFSVRKGMLEQELTRLGLSETVAIDSIEDHPVSNQLWSEELDNKIEKHVGAKNAVVTLYGSRDSFTGSYFGKHVTSVIDDAKESGVSLSGTAMRERVLAIKEDELTQAHREGMIYGLAQGYPVGMSVVDVLVYKKEGEAIYFLLGRKEREVAFRIIGGFFDVTVDATLEDAALRELKEEAGSIVTTSPIYVSSKKVDDWRYRDNKHKIVSSLFIVQYREGECVPSDDIKELMWVRQEDISSTLIVESHREFIDKGIAYLKAQ